MGAVVKRVLLVGLVVAGGAIVMRLLAPRLASVAEVAFEKMPDDAPPKWMFNNITAIREQTAAISEQNERITELLESGQPVGSAPGAPA